MAKEFNFKVEQHGPETLVVWNRDISPERPRKGKEYKPEERALLVNKDGKIIDYTVKAALRNLASIRAWKVEKSRVPNLQEIREVSDGLRPATESEATAWFESEFKYIANGSASDPTPEIVSENDKLKKELDEMKKRIKDQEAKFKELEKKPVKEGAKV